MPLPSQSTRPGQRSRSMLLMPLAVAAARRATASCSSRAKMMSSALALAPSSAAATLYSIMRRRPSPLRLHFPSPTAAGAIRRPFAASTSAIASPPRSNKRLSNRSPNQGQLGTPLKAAAGGGGGGGGAAGDTAAASALPSHCSGCGVSLQGSDPNLPGYFQVPKPKKKPGDEQQLFEQESSATAAAAVLSKQEDDSSEEDDEDEDDDLAAAAATAALFDATDSLDGQVEEEEVDLSDFDDDELFLDAAALGYELKDDAELDEDEGEDGEGGDDDEDARLARAVSRALAAAAASASPSSLSPSSLSSSSSSSLRPEEQRAPDVEAALSAFDAAIDSWDLGGGRSGFGDFDEEDADEDDISFLLDIEDEDDDDDEGASGDESGQGSASSSSPSSSSTSSSSPAKKPLCARCFSLVNYGKVKNAAAEAALPSFDLAAVVGRKLALTKFRRQIVLVVVDVADFDGSLPRAELRAMLPPLEEEGGGGTSPSSSSSSPSAPVSLVLAVNKADTLPAAATGTRVADWARRRARAAGVRRPDAVHVVSAARGTGVRQLLADLHSRLGGRGDVWVVGSQNAGKSSLLNAMKAEVARWKRGGGGGEGEGGLGVGGRRNSNKKGGKKGGPLDLDDNVIKNPITAAPLPGTTLGVLRVRGLLPRGCKMLDTPGAPSPRSVIAALPRGAASAAADAALLLPRSRLRPRTFRASAGQSLLLGGLARVDVVDPPSGGGPTLYLTVWAAGPVGVHYGSTEAAARARASLVARGTLVPPTVVLSGGGGGGGGDDDGGGEERRERVAAAAAAFSSSAVAEQGGEINDDLETAASLRFDQALGLAAPLVPLDVPVSGDSWKRSSVDVAVAGLGWVSVALSGSARLRVWAPRGVSVTVREALVPDMARELGRPGFNGQPVKEVGGGGGGGGGRGGGGGGAGGGKAKGGGKKKKKKSN